MDAREIVRLGKKVTVWDVVAYHACFLEHAVTSEKQENLENLCLLSAKMVIRVSAKRNKHALCILNRFSLCNKELLVV